MASSKPSREMVFAVAVSAAVHAFWLVREANASHLPEVPPAEIILEAYEAPPPPKEEPKEPEPNPVQNQHIIQRAVTTKAMASAPALPVAAQAGKTLTAPDDGKSDLADFTLVQGTGTDYAGGTTSAIGTSAQAVRGPAANTTLPSRVGTEKPIAPTLGPDRSQRPRPTGNDWNCSRLFPNDADAGDFAMVSIVVTVGPDGSPKAVSVLRDPGHGFGAAARACALSQRFSVGLDRDGNPTTATTPPITVRFTR